MRKKAGPVISALLLIIVIVLIFVVGRKIEQYIPSEEVEDLNTYYSITSADDVAIVLNQELIDQKAQPQERVVCDYIAGMTDQYAIDRFAEIFIPKAWRG